jgi:hypothetical protein
MHPLLVSAVASTAGNFLDRWARGSGAVPTAGAQSFQTALEKMTAAPKSGLEQFREMIARLRAQLLDSLEVRAVLDSSDPSKPTAIEVAADGRLLATAPGRDPKALLLSPETADLARKLAALTQSQGAMARTQTLVA